MTTKFTITRMVNTMMPMTKLPLITKLPNASMTWPAAAVPFVAARQDQARRGEVERQPQHGRDQQHGREGGEFQRRVDEQRRHQDQHREDDRDRQREIEQDRRQRQDQDDQDGQHADRERDVAALDERAEVAEAGQRDAARRGRGGRCGGDVAHSTHRACRMVVSENRLPPFGIMRCRHAPGGSDTEELTSSNRAGRPGRDVGAERIHRW